MVDLCFNPPFIQLIYNYYHMTNVTKFKYAVGFLCALLFAGVAQAQTGPDPVLNTPSVSGNENSRAEVARTYIGRDGKTYTERDFTGSRLRLFGLARDGKANFYWSQPPKFYDGFALYVTEGNFNGGLKNYDPIYLSKDTFSYTYPSSTGVSARTRVSAHVYAYIELQGGAKKFIQPGKRASVIVLPGRPVPPPPITVCGDKSGGDATYNVCVGDMVTHTPSGALITLKSQNGDFGNVEIKDEGTFKLSKFGSPLIVELNNGQVLKVELNPRDPQMDNSTGSFRLTISTVTQLKKGDKTGLADGSYEVFVGDSLAHASSSVGFNVDWYLKNGSETVQLSFVNVTGTVTGTQMETLTMGSSKVLTANSGAQLKVTLVSISAGNVLTFRLETVPQPPPPPSDTCEDQTGGDGVYSLCIGSTVMHEPTGITLEVLYYLRIGRFAHLGLDGAVQNSVYVSYWLPVVVDSSTGKKLKVTYLPETDNTHLMIRLTTVQ